MRLTRSWACSVAALAVAASAMAFSMVAAAGGGTAWALATVADLVAGKGSMWPRMSIPRCRAYSARASRRGPAGAATMALASVEAAEAEALRRSDAAAVARAAATDAPSGRVTRRRHAA